MYVHTWYIIYCSDTVIKSCDFWFTDQGYDPFSPEVVRPGGNYNGEPPSSLSTGQDVDLGTMELELVNRAIEAVRNEMERDKKKLSQIGDQDYEPTKSSLKRPKPTAPSHQGYDPGSYQMGQASEYTPTPRSSKYTLDSENCSTNSLEYVPTVVSKTRIKKALPPPPSHVKCKYTLDNSKPTTDMEYDPLLNYSAKLTVKEQRTSCSVGEGRKRFHPEKQGEDEEYVPTAKKPRSPLHKADVPKYTASFSESDEESSGTEYRPTSIRRMQRKGINISLKPEQVSGAKGQQRNQMSKTDYVFSQSESDDVEFIDRTDKKMPVSQSKNIKLDKLKNQEKESNKKSQKERRESSSANKTSKNSSQKDKNQIKNEDRVSKSKEKLRNEGSKSKSTDEQNKKIVKMKNEHSHKEKDRGSGNIKKPKMDKPVKTDKVSSKIKDQKNGKLESSTKCKDKKKSSHGSSSTKDKSKKSSSVVDHREASETKQRNVSHIDLFGAESAEEDEEDERIVRKSASAFKRGSLTNKKKTSEDTSSSEDDSEVDDDDGGGDEAVDYSCLQNEMEYDSDPMEECLRIFNESKEVKTEDKGRQAKQVPHRVIYLIIISIILVTLKCSYGGLRMLCKCLLLVEFSGFSVATEVSVSVSCVCF